MSRGGGYNSSYKAKGGYQGNWNNGHGNNNNNNSNNGPYKKSLSNYKGNGKNKLTITNNSNGGNKWNRNNNYQNNQSPNSILEETIVPIIICLLSQ